MNKETLNLGPEGWTLILGDNKIYYAGDLFSIEFDGWLAEKLGVTLEEAWKMKIETLNRWWPKNLDEVRRLFPRIIGEDENVKLLVLALFSLKLREPSERLMGVIVEASNSAGKSYIVREILKPLQSLNMVFEFTRMTGAFLERKFRDQNLDRKIIFLQEANYAPAQLHLALSEGKLHIGLVEKIGDHFEPIEIVCEGQPFLILTTVHWKGTQDLLHRCIIVNLDESPQQTKRIIEFQSKLNSDPVFMDAFERFAIGCEKAFRRLWENTPENVKVIIPFLDLVVEELKKIESLSIKLRRDFNYLVALIKASAILFHKKRLVLTKEKDGFRDVVIIASFEDLENVMLLLNSNMQQLISDLNQKELQVVEAMKRSGMEFFTYNELARLTGLPSSSLRHYIMPRLEAKGYVIIDRDVRPHRIELAQQSYPVPNLHVDTVKIEKLIKKCLNSLLSFGYVVGHGQNGEKSLEKVSDSQKKPAELAAGETANSAGFFSENPESGSDSENTPEELAISTAAKDSGSFSENEAEIGEISELWPWPSAPGPCENCGREVSERYPIKIFGGWIRLLCRSCASEAVA
ncbi:MAG: hypothetical protein QXL22_04380 [Candidatus Nezhaarchaeales archaeon]